MPSSGYYRVHKRRRAEEISIRNNIEDAGGRWWVIDLMTERLRQRLAELARRLKANRARFMRFTRRAA